MPSQRPREDPDVALPKPGKATSKTFAIADYRKLGVLNQVQHDIFFTFRLFTGSSLMPRRKSIKKDNFHNLILAVDIIATFGILGPTIPTIVSLSKRG
jgi:hypothetical protein